MSYKESIRKSTGRTLISLAVGLGAYTTIGGIGIKIEQYARNNASVVRETYLSQPITSQVQRPLNDSVANNASFHVQYNGERKK